MKQLIQLGLLSNLLLSTTSFAVNPVHGFYLGLLGELSNGPSSYVTVFREDHELFVGRINNSRIGGGGGAMLGYRYESFRFEAEALYNWIGSGTMSVGNCTLQSPAVPTPTGECANLDDFEGKELGFNGSVASMYGMVNVFYDIVNYDSDKNVFPYVGMGIGHGQVTRRGNFVNTSFPEGSQPSHGTKASASSSAAQIILGIGYFMDDFTWAGMDYRYLTTNNLKSFDDKRYAINTLNFNINLSFDKATS